mgnify:CR=1 FL=1
MEENSRNKEYVEDSTNAFYRPVTDQVGIAKSDYRYIVGYGLVSLVISLLSGTYSIIAGGVVALYIHGFISFGLLYPYLVAFLIIFTAYAMYIFGFHLFKMFTKDSIMLRTFKIVYIVVVALIIANYFVNG